MASVLTSLLIIGMLLEVAQHCSSGTSCVHQRQTSMKLTIISKRNYTGHWTAQAQLEHGSNTANEGGPTTAPWTLNLEQNAEQCDGLESVVLVATVTAPPSRAAPGYVFYKDVGYYKMHTTPKTWLEARDTCENEGAHLAILNTEQESKIMQDMFTQSIPNKNINWAFIGFHDRYVEGQYLTVFDEPLYTTGFNRWSHPGQPDNSGGNTTAGEDCGTVHRNGGLNDYPCGKEVPFFCEQELWYVQDRPEIRGYINCKGNKTIPNKEENLLLGTPV